MCIRDREKENLLQKAARGRQVLTGSQFSDRDSITGYMESTRKLYADYQNAAAACSRKSLKAVSYTHLSSVVSYLFRIIL